MKSYLSTKIGWTAIALAAIGAILIPAQANADTFQKQVECTFGRLDNRRNCSTISTYSAEFNNLKISGSLGAVFSGSPNSGTKVSTPIRFGTEWNNQQNTTSVSLGVGGDLANQSFYPALKVKARQKVQNTEIIAGLETQLYGNNADTVTDGLRQTKLASELRQKFSDASQAYIQYTQEFYSDSNQVGQIRAGYQHKVGIATQISANILHRNAASYNPNYWSPTEGVTQISTEIRQIVPLSKSATIQVGARVGAQIKGGNQEVEPLIGGGIALRKRFSPQWYTDAFFVAGYGFKAGFSLVGDF